MIAEPVPIRRNDWLHRYWNIEVRDKTHLNAVEAGLDHANYRHHLIVDEQGLVQDAGVITKMLVPVTMPQHNHGIAALRGAVGGQEQATERRANPKRVKVIAGHNFRDGAFRLAMVSDANGVTGLGGESRENGIVIAKIFVYRIGE